ncbi:hypothetical protein CsSME_00015177 [Camellia sinensis var. sinensis]
MTVGNERLCQELTKSQKALRYERGQSLVRRACQHHSQRHGKGSSSMGSSQSGPRKQNRVSDSSSSDEHNSLRARQRTRKQKDDDSGLKDRHNLFVWRIAKAAFPKKFKAPSFTLYDGKSDPTDHVRRYK